MRNVLSDLFNNARSILPEYIREDRDAMAPLSDLPVGCGARARTQACSATVYSATGPVGLTWIHGSVDDLDEHVIRGQRQARKRGRLHLQRHGLLRDQPSGTIMPSRHTLHMLVLLNAEDVLKHVNGENVERHGHPAMVRPRPQDPDRRCNMR